MKIQKQSFCLGALSLLIGLLTLLSVFDFPLHQHGDNSGYLILGMSFAQGKGFVDISQPLMPHFLWWPPGFPLFISLFYKIFGPNWYLLKVLIFVCLYIAIYFFSHFIQKNEKSLLPGILLTTAIGLSSAIHLVSSYLYSEIFFIIVSITFFLLWDKWHKNLSIQKILMLSLIALYLGTIRNIGLCLPLTLALYLGLTMRNEKEKKLRLSFLLPIALIIMYSASALFVPKLRVGSFGAFFGVDSYEKQQAGGFELIKKNNDGHHVSRSGALSRNISKVSHSLRGYVFTLIPQTVLRKSYYSFPMSKTKALIMVIITFVILFGWYRSIRPYPLIALYTIIFLCVLIFYGPLYIRLLVPIVPFLFLYLYKGIQGIIEWRVKKTMVAGMIVGILWAGVVADNAWWTFSMPRKDMKVAFGDRQYQKALAWIIGYASKDDIVACQTSWYLFLKRNGYTIPVQRIYSHDDVFSFFDKNKIRYMIVSGFKKRPNNKQWEFIEDIIEKNPEKFKVVCGVKGKGSYIIEYDKYSEK